MSRKEVPPREGGQGTLKLGMAAGGGGMHAQDCSLFFVPHSPQAGVGHLGMTRRSEEMEVSMSVSWRSHREVQLEQRSCIT